MVEHPLSHCYGLPRLSEDLDFISLKKDLEIEKLTIDLKNYYENKVNRRYKLC